MMGLAQRFAAGWLLALAIALGLALILSRAVARPVSELAAAAEAIAAGDYSRRVEKTGSDELGGRQIVPYCFQTL